MQKSNEICFLIIVQVEKRLKCFITTKKHLNSDEKTIPIRLDGTSEAFCSREKKRKEKKRKEKKRKEKKRKEKKD